MNSTAATFVPMAPLESIVCTEELNRRPSRPPDHERENGALVALVQAMADSPRTILETMAAKMLEVFRCDSAGFSLLSKDEKRFYWAAIAGAWHPHQGGGTPREFGPCGDVLDCNAPLMFRHWERRYPHLLAATPAAEEGLLVPFYVEGKAVGTIWAIAHDDRRKFDNEDLRMLVSLGTFASAAYQTVEHLHALGEAQDRQEAAQAMREMNEALLVSSLRQHELMEVADSLNARLRSAVETRDHFLAVLSHELRNPLAAIRNAVTLATRSGTREDLEWSRDITARQVMNFAHLIDDLLDVSRVSQGKIKLRKEIVDAGSVLRHAVEAVKPLVAGKSHELLVSLTSPDLRIEADATRLEQMIVNLLTNAAKYTPSGGRIELIAGIEGDEFVCRVKDNGVGIAPELMSRMFDLFAQADHTLARSEGGLGIGLSLVRSLAELHGGTITAASAGPNQGSEFSLRLPAALSPAALALDSPKTGPEPGSARGLRALVVDDNEDTADAMGKLLRFSGYTVQVAYNGPDAIASAQEHGPEVVILDIGLPGMDGYEVATRLRREEGCKEAVLIALTGYGEEQARTRTAEAGFNHHLVKPVNFDTLLAILARHESGA